MGKEKAKTDKHKEMKRCRTGDGNQTVSIITKYEWSKHTSEKTETGRVENKTPLCVVCKRAGSNIDTTDQKYGSGEGHTGQKVEGGRWGGGGGKVEAGRRKKREGERGEREGGGRKKGEEKGRGGVGGKDREGGGGEREGTSRESEKGREEEMKSIKGQSPTQKQMCLQKEKRISLSGFIVEKTS